MSLAVVFRPQAEAEFEAAQAWYEDRETGLGQEFVSCVQAPVERIRRSPEQFPNVDFDVRRAVARRFPYAVFFLADPELITVIAVFHTSRDPKEWQQRATGRAGH